MTSLGMEKPCVYKWACDSVVIFFVLYVDDILLLENDILTLQSVKLWLSLQFSMKDLGEASYILGMKIYKDRSRRLLGLFQSTYIDTLKRFNIDNFKKGYLSIGHGIMFLDRKSTRLNSSHSGESRMPSSA